MTSWRRSTWRPSRVRSSASCPGGAGSTLLRKFTETGEPEDLCDVPDGCWTGLTWAGGYLWGVINSEGGLYRIDPATGEVVTILDGLNYPQDLEFLPVVLEEPAQP